MNRKFSDMICLGCGEKIELEKEDIYYKIERFVRTKTGWISQVVFYHKECPINWVYFTEDLEKISKHQSILPNFEKKIRIPKPEVEVWL